MKNIDQNKLISVEEFCNEMGRLIYYFDQTIDTTKAFESNLIVSIV